jgi:hypothetical protein
MESLNEEVIRLTSILEQVLRSKSGEATSLQPTVTTQFAFMPAIPFIPHNLGGIEAPPES